MAERITVTRDELSELVRTGEIDTVVMAFPDQWGRLVGKRTTGRFFLDHVADEGTENCDYLLACDIDNNPTPGYRFASYDRGYGDIRAVADWSTVRILDWVAHTALVLCDVQDVGTGELVAVAPRTVLRRQEVAAREVGFTARVASEIEFYLFLDTYREAHDNGYRALRPHSPWLQDYHVLQTTHDEYVIGRIRRSLEAAGVPVEFSKGEAGRGQHEINLDHAPPVEMADRNAVFKTAVKEIAAAEGRSVTFMAKWAEHDTGSSCHVHSSLWDATTGHSAFAPSPGEDMTDTFRHFLAGLVATAREFSLLWAPTVNSYKRFQVASWAPTAIGWGVDNRTLGFRVVGHGPSTRVESRVPGADANTYLAFAGVLAGGLHGIREQLDLPPAHAGSGYAQGGDAAERLPASLAEAADAWERSEVARACFGDDVHDHVLSAARGEFAAFGSAVTDWELRRYWERI